MVLPVRLVPAKTGKAKIARAKMVRKEGRERQGRQVKSRLESLAKEMASPRLGRVHRIVSLPRQRRPMFVGIVARKVTGREIAGDQQSRHQLFRSRLTQECLLDAKSRLRIRKQRQVSQPRREMLARASARASRKALGHSLRVLFCHVELCG